MDLGAPRQGDRLLITLLCRAEDTGAPVLPQAAPWASVYGGPDNVRFSFRLPAADRVNAPGLFARTLHLDDRFRPGRYCVRFTYKDQGGATQDTLAFFVVPEGGHPDGAIIALQPFVVGPNVFLVKEHDSGKITKGLNPSV